MKKTSLIILFLMLFVSVNSISQNISSVTINGLSYRNSSKYTIEIVNPQYEVETKNFKSRDGNFYVLMKKELDIWLSKGYKLESTSSNGYSTSTDLPEFNLTYILIKEE